MNAAAQELFGLRVLPGDYRLERSGSARSGANFCGEKYVLSGEGVLPVLADFDHDHQQVAGVV